MHQFTFFCPYGMLLLMTQKGFLCLRHLVLIGSIWRSFRFILVCHIPIFSYGTIFAEILKMNVMATGDRYTVDEKQINDWKKDPPLPLEGRFMSFLKIPRSVNTEFFALNS
jgi:hypothetical protein